MGYDPLPAIKSAVAELERITKMYPNREIEAVLAKMKQTLADAEVHMATTR